MNRNLRLYGHAALVFFLLAFFLSPTRAEAVPYFLALLLVVPVIASVNELIGLLLGRYRRSHFVLSTSGEEI